MRMILLALGVAVFVLLAGIALSASIVFALGSDATVSVLLSLTGVYGLLGVLLYWRLSRLLHNWEILSASLAEIRKDRAIQEGIAP
jgi:uncharacterized membrane protein YqjE